MDFEKEILKICEFFERDFANEYSQIRKQGKSIILKHYNSIYRKWYYSSFFNENVLTPAHIVHRLNERFCENEYFVPFIKTKSKLKFCGFEEGIIKYSVDEHPIIVDLNIFLSNCPVISFESEGLVVTDEINSVLEKISFDEILYVEYLLYLAERLGLVKKMPSIYSQVYCVEDDYETFFQRDKRECFDDAVKAAISLSCASLNNFFPEDERFFSYEYIEEIIKNPVSVDDVFKDIFNSVGVDIESFWNDEKESLDKELGEFEDAVLSSAYFLRILIDKWFIIPFGDYFKFFMPLYHYPYDIGNKMNDLMEEKKHNIDFEFSPSIYYPSSTYYSTVITYDYFNIEKKKDEYADIFDRFSLENVIETVVAVINSGVELEGIKISEKPQECEEIYEIKVKLMEDKSYWKVFEFEADATLSDVHKEIADEMRFYHNVEYSFFTDYNMSPFSEYTSMSNLKRLEKKTETTTILDLNLDVNQKIVYKYVDEYNACFTGSDEVLFEIELLKIKDRKPRIHYPRVARISSFAKIIDGDMIF